MWNKNNKWDKKVKENKKSIIKGKNIERIKILRMGKILVKLITSIIIG